MASTTCEIPHSSKKDFKYILVKEFENNSASPVNAVVFSRDGKYLLSGGDDEIVRIWNLDTFACDQVIKNEDWGQVTALTLMYPEGNLGILGTKFPHLCVGSGLGAISVLPMERAGVQPFTQAKSLTTILFSFCNPVMLQAHDASHSRLAVASQSGDIRMFSLEQPSLTPLWTSNIYNTPAALFFHGLDNDSLLTLSMQNSELCTRDAKTGEVSSRKEFRGASGTAALADDDTTLLISNLSTGKFDLYQLPDLTPLRSLPLFSACQYIKQCSFLQGSSSYAICGSEFNYMSIVDVSRNEVFATLATGKASATSMTQTVASSTKGSPCAFVAGASGGMIFLWERVAVRKLSLVQALPVKKAARSPPQTDSNTKFILAFVLLVTYANWAPPLLSLLKTVANIFGSFMTK